MVKGSGDGPSEKSATSHRGEKQRRLETRRSNSNCCEADPTLDPAGSSNELSKGNQRSPDLEYSIQIGLQYLTTMDHHMKESFYD
jgi:hypothetical protein